MEAVPDPHLDRGGVLSTEDSDRPETPAEREPDAGPGEGAQRRRPSRGARRLARILGLLSLAIALALFQFTQTTMGRNAALALLQRALEGAIDGEVRVGPVLGGNLVTRVVLSHLELTDPAGNRFVALDTVTVEYDPLALVRKQVRIRRIDARRADVRLVQSADGIWNHERIFRTGGADPAPDSAAAGPRGVAPDSALSEPAAPLRVILGDARVRDGRFELRVPWTATLEGAERDAAFARAAAGEAVWSYEETAGGELEQVFRLERMSGRFPLIRLSDPPLPFRIDMENLGTVLHAVGEPIAVDRFTGRATFGDSIRVDIEHFDTASSSLSGGGWVVPSDPVAYAFELDADPLDFADLRWLPVALPRSGGGSMRLAIASRGEDMAVAIEDGDVRSEDTRLRGDVTLVVSDPPRVESMDLQLQPLRLRWLDRVLDREPGVDGWVRGSVRGSGSASDLRIDADVAFADLEGSGPPSRVRAVGGLGIEEGFPMRGLRLELTAFQPRWVAALGVESPIGGRLAGTVTLDREPGADIRFDGDVSHTGPGGQFSRALGTGAIDLDAGFVSALAIDVRPLSLSLLRSFVPDVEIGEGTLQGPVRMTGTRERFQANVDLVTQRGRVVVDGVFSLAEDAPSYDAEIEATDLSLDQWVEGAPDSRLAIRGRAVGTGVDPATLASTFDLQVLPSTIEQAAIYDSRIRFRVEDGMAEIDTLIVDTDVGYLTGSGRFGLAEGRQGTVEVEAEVRDLSEWNRWFAEEIPGGVEAGAGVSLFEDFEAALSADREDEPDEGLAGRIDARGIVVGGLDDFTVEAFVEAAGARYFAYRADTLSARIQLPAPPDLDAVIAQVTATGVSLAGRSLDSLAVAVERSLPGALQLDLHARRDSTVEMSTRGALAYTEVTWRADLEWARLRMGKLESELAGPATIAYSDSALVVRDLTLNGPLGRIVADGRIPAVGDGNLEFELFGVRLDQFGYLLSETPEVGGTLEATGRIAGSLAEPRITGSGRILDPSVRQQRYASVDATFEYADRLATGAFELNGARARLARLDGTVRADLALRPVEERLLADPIDLELRGDSIPLALIELKVSGLEEITGVGYGQMTLEGEPGDLQYGGSLQLVDGQAWVPDLGIWLQRVGGRISFRGSEARLDSGYVASDLGGFVRASGEVDIGTLSNPEFAIDLDADRFHAVSRLDMSLEIDGTGQLTGEYRAPILSGEFRLRDGDIRQDEFLRARQVIDLSDPMIFTLLDSTSVGDRRLLEGFQNPFMDNLIIDARVSLGPNLWLRSPELDVEMVATDLEVDVDRARDLIQVVGLVELPRGTYRFDRVPPYVQSLRITGGTIQFVGDAELNPNLQINAEYRNRTAEGPVVVNAQIGGTLQESTLDLSSNPPMSENDQFCFLAVGAPCFRAADSGLGQRVFQQAFLGTLNTGLGSALVSSTGLSYFNLRSVGGQSSGVQGSESLIDQTLLEFGWYASDDLFLSFSQPLGGGPPRATLEWTFLPMWTLEARAASRFDERLFGLARGTNLANEQTFGLFLFRDWNY